MAKKKKKQPKRSPRHRQQRTRRAGSKPAPEGFPGRLSIEREIAQLGKILSEQEFEDIDEANEFLQNLLAQTGGRMPVSEPETPLEQAQELIYEAWEAPPRKAERLAKKALSISRDCADAYLILAQLETESFVKKIELCREAVAAGERAIDAENVEEHRGHFWGAIETRPYMRARLELADQLWHYGEVEEALSHYNALLELNPDDNQGVRYILVNHLLKLLRNDEAEELLTRYDEEFMANWLYNRALLLFRKHGRSPQSHAALEKALGQNEWVPGYLLGIEEPPEEIPEYHGLGDESEAMVYASEAFLLWAMTPGAILWLAEQAAEFFG